jgi:hypothetical protein
MRELPILMNGAMVRAVLEGRKTVTRRLVKRQPFVHHWQMFPEYTGQWRECAGLWRFEHRIPHNPNPDIEEWLRPPCQIGDRLYVRETTVNVEDHGYVGPVFAVSDDGVAIREGGLGPAEDDCEVEPEDIKLRTALHMPKAWARIWLEVTAVRVERLQDITTEQIIAEGISSRMREHDAVVDLRQQFVALWDGLAKPEHRLAKNPWVWVVEFRRVEHVPGPVTADYRGCLMEASAP